MTSVAPGRRLVGWAGSLVPDAEPGRRVLRDAAILVATIIVVLRATGILFPDGVDFYAYWSTNLTNPYEGAQSSGPGFPFLYTPVFAQVTEPLRWLPFNLAFAAWTALELGCLIWLAGPWALALMLPLSGEWMNGNVHLVMAAAVVWGMKQPAGWLVPAFTKVSPALGLGWFVLRGEWRFAAKALAILVGVAAVSFALAPQLWFAYAQFLVENVDAMPPPGSMQLPLVVRFGVAGALLVWAARTNRPWAVPLACAFGLPTLWWSGLIAFAIAAWRLRATTPRWPNPQ